MEGTLVLKFVIFSLILFPMISSSTARALPNQMAASKVVWKAPPAGWIKMNVDWRNWSDDNWTTAGGVFRGSDGQWKLGFDNLEKGKSQLEAIISGFCHGLRLACDNGFRRVKVEMDSAIAYSLINQTEYHGHCKDLIKCNMEVEISLIDKQQNMVANRLAELADSHNSNMTVYDNPPYTIDHLLNVDRNGT